MDYLIKASAVLLIFFVCYKLFLQKDTFFKENRWFLLVGILVSLILPNIAIPVYVTYVPESLGQLIYETEFNSQPLEVVEPSFSIYSILVWIYCIGLSIFTIKFLLEITSLSHLISTSEITKEGRYKFTKVKQPIAPFSFFNWIVLNPKQFLPKELNLIIKHEKVHVRQLHSVDLICAQLLCIVLWFNPFVWLYKNALNQNLEFIADNDTQQTTSCDTSYQELLLKTSIKGYNISITNNFYNSLIKKRIVMLHKNKSKHYSKLKLAAVLPLLAIFLMSFNTKKIFIEAENGDTLFTVSAETNDKNLKDIEKAFKNKTAKLKFTDLVRNDNGKIQRISINTKYPDDKRYIKRMTLNNNLKSETIQSFNLLHKEAEDIIDFNFKQDDVTSNISANKISFSGANSISTLKTPKTKSNPILSIGDTEVVIISKDASDNDLYTIKEQLKKEGITISFKGIKRNKKGEITAIKITAKSDNSEVKYSSKDDDAIEPITIKFGEDGIYIGNSKKSKHKEDYIFISGKGKSKNNTISISSNHEYDNNNSHEDIKISNYKNYLFVKDGKTISVDDLEKIYPKLVETNTISTFNIVKGKKALEVYGKDAKNGVVVITTGEPSKTNLSFNNSDEIKGNIWITKDGKKHNVKTSGVSKVIIHSDDDHDEDDDHEEEIIIINGNDNNNTEDIIIKGEGTNVWTTEDNVTVTKIGKDKKNFFFVSSDDTDGKNPLIIVDGKEIKKKDLSDIDPDTIESITVLKDKKATEKYGKKGENGVIVITLKK
ncbi:M56 family metallopeptidase [Ichthyenterobacterium sp. W332]|uniref:M56 family metallopeptidase n=1 Tax=Microcosmobacter mediterraneus TaxID=3075607 RepID=A0ABU2YN10_9FLAO|nr:M56 family metallopeptidase [Ichthyenterobacterium sp. W332]MDT0559271.1 M56 family metallopeptidase [Ichthyenterobacterium sp. W332]